MKRDLSTKIERLEAMEDRLSVSLSALSAFYEDIGGSHYLVVKGEIQPTTGTTLTESITLEAAAYDTQGRIIGKGSDYYDKEDFFGIEVFDITVSLDVPDVARIRLYPKK